MQVVYGSFDGIRRWHVNAYLTTDLREQELVSAHEERHLRLQQGTPYGAALALLAASASESHTPTDALYFANRCRTVHESYATFLSVQHVEGGIDLLVGNWGYLNYWRHGRSLANLLKVGERTAELEYVFHSLMCPVPTPDDEADPAPLRAALALLRATSPDERLAALVARLRSDPDLSSALRNALAANATVEANLDGIALVLTEAGIPTLNARDQDAVATAIQNAVNTSGGQTRVTLTKRSRRTSLDDHLDYVSRESIRVNDNRLKLRLIEPFVVPEEPHPLRLFVRDDPIVGPHVLAALLTREVFEVQFEVDAIDLPPANFGLLSADRTYAGPIASFMPLSISPARLADDLANVGIRTLPVTTLSSLSFSGRTEFSSNEPLIVLMDELLRPTLLGLAESAPIRWSTFSLTGDRLLHILVMSPVHNPLMHFVKVSTLNTLKPSLEWLRQRGDEFEFLGADYPAISDQLAVVLYHLIGSFESL